MGLAGRYITRVHAVSASGRTYAPGSEIDLAEQDAVRALEQGTAVPATVSPPAPPAATAASSSVGFEQETNVESKTAPVAPAPPAATAIDPRDRRTQDTRRSR